MECIQNNVLEVEKMEDRQWRMWMGLSIYCSQEELESIKDYVAQETVKTIKAVKDACRYYSLEYEEL